MSRGRAPRTREGSLSEKPLSTGEVARYCHVSVASVCNWIRSGKLDAYTTPGGQYRIPPKDFLRFLSHNRIPIPPELRGASGRVILLVDDDPSVIETVGELLRTHRPDCTVVTAMDGYEALIRMGHLKPQLVILDVLMPRLDGHHVCQQIRSTPELAGTRILAITGDPSFDTRERIVREGADACLAKPIDFEDLLRRIEQILPQGETARRAPSGQPPAPSPE